MLKVIDLDHQGKDEGLIFVLSIAGERIGVTDQELIELVKQKYSTAKSAKRATGKKASTTESSSLDSQTQHQGDVESKLDLSSPEGQEAAAH